MSKWPKQLPSLTDEQKRIKDDWMSYWLGILPKRYGIVERFNHGYPARNSRPGGRVLEIGPGLGEHLKYEHLENTEYHALELRPEIADELRRRHPNVKVVTGNCEKSIPFSDAYFDRILAIHVLEHLPNLPAALKEVFRVLKPGGEFRVVIPCEGGLAYGLAQQISSRRIFKKRYGMSYDFCIRSEHINLPNEILEELAVYFDTRDSAFFPLKVPSVTINIAIGLVVTPRARLVAAAESKSMLG
jgi:SAM-dependent methyltransferase